MTCVTITQRVMVCNVPNGGHRQECQTAGKNPDRDLKAKLQRKGILGLIVMIAVGAVWLVHIHALYFCTIPVHGQIAAGLMYGLAGV